MKNSKVVYVGKWICKECDRNSKCTECDYYEKLIRQEHSKNELERKLA
jgi:primosomal protein N'